MQEENRDEIYTANNTEPTDCESISEGGSELDKEPEQVTEEPCEVPEEATEEPCEVIDEAPEEPCEVLDEATEEPCENLEPEEATEEPCEDLEPEEATEEPSEVLDEATEEPIEVLEQVAEEPCEVLEAESDANVVDDAYQDEEESLDTGKKKKKKKDKKAKAEKKKAKKSTRIALIVTAVLLTIAIVTTAIVVPIVIANKDKIFVSTKEDFDNTDGKYFVLKNDLTIDGDLALGALNNIDLNGKTLNITGKLRVNSTGNDKVILGDVKGKGKGGTIMAKDIVIDAESDVLLNATIKCTNVDIKSKSITISEGINVTDTAKITSSKVDIKAPFEFANATKANVLELVDADSVSVDDKVGATIKLVNTRTSDNGAYLTTANIKGKVYGDILGDARCDISIYSEVTGKVDALEKGIDGEGIEYAISKVGKLKIYEKGLVRTIANIGNAYIHVDAIITPNMSHVDHMDLIRPLEAVGYISIDDSTENIKLNFSKVKGADAYIIKIDDKEPFEVTNNTGNDISEYVRDVKKHVISVRAISKANSELLLPSAELKYEYMTYVRLDMASNIAINKNESGKMILTFDKVNFADEYEIEINGNKIVSDSNSVDVTSNITSGGAYIVKIVAVSKNENILSSKPSLYQYDHIVALKPVNISITGSNAKSFKISWDAIENVKFYEVIRVDNEGVEESLYCTAETEFAPAGDNSFNIKRGQKFKVRAISSNPYYTMNESEVKSFDY